MQELLQLVFSEIRSAWRFRWYAVVAAWSVGVAGLGIVAWLPDIYEASARIYVDGASVLRPLLTDRIVAPDVATHLLYVRQALLGREYLERVAAENGLDTGALSTADREKVLDRLRDGIDIQAVPADPKGNPADISSIFTISFRDERPAVAEGVVRQLMNFLIEDTLNANTEGTDIAARFLDEQIADHEARLQKAEHDLAEFRRANSDRLPGSQGGYFERMQNERDALEQTRRDLRLAQSRYDRLQQQLTSQTPVLVEEGDLDREPPPNSLDARIRDHRAELDRLLLQYTDRHPSVVAVRESLDRLEAQRAEQLRALGITDADQQLSTLGANPVYQAVQIAMNQVEVEIATLTADVSDRERRLADLQALIDEVPRVEAELTRLNRDYNVINDQYQGLVKSRETQQLSQQASTTDQVEFRILNPPRAAVEPVAPPRLPLLIGVLVAALAAGAGLSYVLAQLRPVFVSVRSLRDIVGFPVIGSVGAFLSPQRIWRRRVELASFSGAIAALVVVVGAVVAFELAGPGIHSLFGGT